MRNQEKALIRCAIKRVNKHDNLEVGYNHIESICSKFNYLNATYLKRILKTWYKKCHHMSTLF